MNLFMRGLLPDNRHLQDMGYTNNIIHKEALGGLIGKASGGVVSGLAPLLAALILKKKTGISLSPMGKAMVGGSSLLSGLGGSFVGDRIGRSLGHDLAALRDPKNV